MAYSGALTLTRAEEEPADLDILGPEERTGEPRGAEIVGEDQRIVLIWQLSFVSVILS